MIGNCFLNRQQSGTFFISILLKETGTEHWQVDNGSTNSTGFTALPGGMWNPLYDAYEVLGFYAFFWTTTQEEEDFPVNLTFHFMLDIQVASSFNSVSGFSVRCVKD